MECKRLQGYIVITTLTLIVGMYNMEALRNRRKYVNSFIETTYIR